MLPQKIFKDESMLWFAQGKFDKWCVYFKKKNKESFAPKDVQYFRRIQYINQFFTDDTIYKDFTYIYQHTKKDFDFEMLQWITNNAEKYDSFSLEIDKLFSILYFGMVAEENKERTVLGKRIKRLGMHQILFEKMPPEQAAIFSKGKPWRELDRECKSRGF